MHFTVFCFLFALQYDLVCGQNFTYLEFGKYSQNLTTSGNLITDMFLVPLEKPRPAIRIIVNSVNSTVKNPFTVTVVRGKSVMHVSLPRIQPHQSKSFPYWFTADTLCDEDHSPEHLSQPAILSVASALPAAFMLKVKAEDNFHLGHEVLDTTASPSEPRFWLYTFPEYIEKINIRIVSDSDVCARIMARKANCPAFDATGLPEFSDVYFYQSFTKLGSFSLTKADMGKQVHIVYSIEPDDSVCGTKTGIDNPWRVKNSSLTVTPIFDDGLQPIIPLVIYIVVIATVFVIISPKLKFSQCALFSAYYQYKWLDRQENNEPNVLDGTESEGTVFVDKISLFDKPTNTVSHKEYQKNKVIKESKYFNFLIFQLLGSVLPQLTILFQNNISKKKMKVDSCYLNYLCCSNFLGFNCFNGVISSSSLVVVGVVNLIIVFRKKIFRYETPMHPTTHGIQQQRASKVIFLLGIISLSILWTVTSNCPHKKSTHLYIYTHSWSCMSAFMWIYSKRHGIRKWQPLLVIAISSVFGCFSFVENTFEMSTTVAIIKKVLFMLSCLAFSEVIAFNYYFERPSGLKPHQWKSSPFVQAAEILQDEHGIFQPLKSKKIFSIGFFGLSVVWSMLPFVTSSFTVTRCILRMIECNVAFYMIYYLIQKFRFEKSSLTFSYLVTMGFLLTSFLSSCVFWWFIATYKTPYYVFWTPAKSRTLNQECITSGIDWSDMGHYVTSMIFIVFIMIMDFVDSNIKNVPKKHIFVF